jgi:hypothetical protein
MFMLIIEILDCFSHCTLVIQNTIILTIQGPFHQSLVAIGPVVSEEKIKMWKFMTYDGRTPSSELKKS